MSSHLLLRMLVKGTVLRTQEAMILCDTGLGSDTGSLES